MLPACCQMWAQRECHQEQVPHGEAFRGEAWLAGQEDSVINTVKDLRGPISAARLESVCPCSHPSAAQLQCGVHQCLAHVWAQTLCHAA